MVFRKKPWYVASLAEVNWIKLDLFTLYNVVSGTGVMGPILATHQCRYLTLGMLLNVNNYVLICLKS